MKESLSGKIIRFSHGECENIDVRCLDRNLKQPITRKFFYNIPNSVVIRYFQENELNINTGIEQILTNINIWKFNCP